MIYVAREANKRWCAMSAAYEVARISPEGTDQAYPLVSLVAPTLSLNAWQDLCRSVASRRGHCANLDDVIIATNPLGYIQGLCVVAVRNHALHGHLLDVPIIVIASAADEAGVAAHMLAYLRTLARAEGCDSIRIWTQDGWARRLEDCEIQSWEQGVLLRFAPNPGPT